MRILSVDLENIKSYRRQAIVLESGLNAICGLNGSGKTTVLEAIGFALFNHLPYNQAAFVREGEKTGTIRVRIEALDGREYEVVRKVGSSSQYYVVDVESGVRPAERAPNVLVWIRENALGLEGETDLEALFENAVGVPQGKMTSDFLGSAGTRKSIFDPLLRVEEYERAWKSLSETMSNLRERGSMVREDIARLQTDVEKIPAFEAECALLAVRMEESERQIGRIAAELTDAQDRRAVLDLLQQDLAARDHDLRGAEYEVRRLSDRAGMLEQRLRAAQEARRIVERSQDGYEKKVAADAKLDELRREEQERNKLSQRLAEVRTAAQHIEQQIQTAMTERQRAQDDAIQAAALAPEVARQAELESSLDEAMTRVREHARLGEDLKRLEREVADLERGARAREAQIVSAERAERTTGRLSGVESRHRAVRDRLALLPSLETQLREIQAEGKRLRGRHDVLQEGIRRLAELRREIEVQAPVAGTLSALQEQERRLNEERIHARATLDYQEVARADLERQRCPLLQLQCPVVTADGRVLSRLDVQADVLTRRAGELDAELREVRAALDRAAGAAQELQRLQIAAAKFEGNEPQHAEVTESLERCRTQYAELSSVIADVRSLQSEDVSLAKEIEQLQAAAAEAARLPVLREAQQRDREALEARSRDVSRIQDSRATLAVAEADADRIRGELAGLGDPRSRQMKLHATAAQLARIESQISERQRELKETVDRLRAITAEISTYGGLDERIQGQQQIRLENQPDFERYLQNRDEAGQVETRHEALAETAGELDLAQVKERECRERLAAARDAYDPERHEAVRSREDALRQDLGRATADQEHLGREIARVESELARLRRLQERVQSRFAELDELGRTETATRFVRETIRAAGPTLTETLLTNISQVANDIFAEIMDDHAVELRWDRDYEVLLRRGPEDRKFAQLSGGEQMSAALSLRLALLKEMSEVNVAFFDEPTQNMDQDRRVNLADQIRQVRGFEQMIVISHDDTFEHHTDNVVRVVKNGDETRVES